MWSSYTVKPYLRVTVHFVTEDFNLKAPCFQIAYFPQATTHDHRRPHRGKYCSRPKRVWVCDCVFRVSEKENVSVCNGNSLVSHNSNCMNYTFFHNHFFRAVQEAGGALPQLEEEGSNDWGTGELKLPEHTLIIAQQDWDPRKRWLPECWNRPKFPYPNLAGYWSFGKYSQGTASSLRINKFSFWRGVYKHLLPQAISAPSGHIIPDWRRWGHRPD